MSARHAWSLIGCLLLWPALIKGDVERVRVNIEGGRIRFAPADLRVRFTVDPHEANRLLVMEAEAGTFYRRTDEDLTGSSARTRWMDRWRDFPPGAYVITGTVYTATGETFRAVDKVEIRDWSSP